MDSGLSKLQEMVKDREARCAAVHRVTKSQTWLSDQTTRNTYIPSFIGFPLHQVTPEHLAEFPMLYSTSSLVIYFIHSTVYMSVSISLFLWSKWPEINPSLQYITLFYSLFLLASPPWHALPFSTVLGNLSWNEGGIHCSVLWNAGLPSSEMITCAFISPLVCIHETLKYKLQSRIPVLFIIVPVVVQLLSCVWLFVILWTAVCQDSLSFTVSQSLLKWMSFGLVMLSNHLIFCHPLLLLPSILRSIRVFSNELVPHIRWPKY